MRMQRWRDFPFGLGSTLPFSPRSTPAKPHPWPLAVGRNSPIRLSISVSLFSINTNSRSSERRVNLQTPTSMAHTAIATKYSN